MEEDDDHDHISRLRALDLNELLALEKRTPSDADLLVEIGRRSMHRREFTVAHQYYLRALEIDSADGWTHLYLGNLYFGCRLFSEAIACFCEGAALLPGVSCPYWCLGDVYAKMGRDSRAEKHYKKAVFVEPDCQRAKARLERWHRRKHS